MLLKECLDEKHSTAASWYCSLNNVLSQIGCCADDYDHGYSHNYNSHYGRGYYGDEHGNFHHSGGSSSASAAASG